MMYWHDAHWTMMLLWWGVGLALLAMVVWAIARAARSPAGGPPDAELELKRRYARGEIDRHEYQQRLHDLRS